jgi:hypothetical protein
MRQAPVWQAFESVAPTLAYDAAAMGDYWVPAERTASVTVPALVLDGGASPDFMHEAADALSDALPLAERRTLEAQTHDVAPEVIAPVLQEFFAA